MLCRSGLVLACLVACGGTPSPAKPPIAATVAKVATRSDASIEADFAAAWTMWAAGDRAGAIAALAKLRAGQPITPGLHGYPAAVALRADGKLGVAISGGGVYWIDPNGVPLRYENADAADVAFLGGSSLVVFGGKSLTVVDSNTFAPVLRAAESDYLVSPSGETLFYAERAPGAPERLHVWDVAKRSDRKVITLRAGESIATSVIRVSPDERAFSAQVFRHCIEVDGSCAEMPPDLVAVFDGDAPRLDFEHDMFALPPAYSRDGKWMAYGHSSFTGNAPNNGKIFLVDRATRRVIEREGLGYPTGTRFSNRGKLLIVGDLRRLSILAVPSLRVLATTSYVRERFYEDDMQNFARIEIVGDDLGFVAETADGTSAVFHLPSGAQATSGPLLKALDEAPSAPPTAADKLSILLDRTVCTANNRLYPIAACP